MHTEKKGGDGLVRSERRRTAGRMGDASLRGWVDVRDGALRVVWPLLALGVFIVCLCLTGCTTGGVSGDWIGPSSSHYWSHSASVPTGVATPGRNWLEGGGG